MHTVIAFVFSVVIGLLVGWLCKSYGGPAWASFGFGFCATGLISCSQKLDMLLDK